MKAVKVSGSCLKSEGSFLKSVACFCSEKPALGYFTFSQYLSEAKASLHIVAIFPLRTFTCVSCCWSIYQPALSTTQGLLHSIRPQRCYLFPFASLLEMYVLGKSVGKNPLFTPVRCQRPSTNWHSNICNTYSNNKITTVLHVGFFFFFDRWTAMACYLSLPPIKMHIGSALACHLPLLGKVGCGPRFRWAGFFHLAIVLLISAL